MDFDKEKSSCEQYFLVEFSLSFVDDVFWRHHEKEKVADADEWKQKEEVENGYSCNFEEEKEKDKRSYREHYRKLECLLDK